MITAALAANGAIWTLILTLSSLTILDDNDDNTAKINLALHIVSAVMLLITFIALCTHLGTFGG